jgi:urease accessory protein
MAAPRGALRLIPEAASATPPIAEQSSRRGLEGHLELVCACDAHGRTFLRHQSFRAPIHLSKPHLDRGVLVLNVVNPTAGLLAGDRIRSDVEVEAGARLLLTTPSASRAHSSGREWSEVDQSFRIAAGGKLENWPELFIPQRGSSYRQRTTIEIEPGGELLFFETLAPGRVAMGEAFAYTALDWETTITIRGCRIARERYRLDPTREGVAALRERFATAYYASCFVITPELDAGDPCWERIHELHERSAWVGCSALLESGWVIKVITEGSVLLRRKLAAIRQILYAALNRPAPELRRAGELLHCHTTA